MSSGNCKEAYREGVRLSRTMAFMRGFDLHIFNCWTNHEEIRSLDSVELPCSWYFSLVLPRAELCLLGGCYLESGRGCDRPMLISSRTIAIKDQCRSLGHMRKPRCKHAAILFDSTIYVFGGNTPIAGTRFDNSHPERSCEKQSLLVESNWEEMEPMLEARCEFTVCAYRRFIYLCSGSKQTTAERYAVDLGRFEPLSVACPREIWGTVVVDGGLIWFDRTGYQRLGKVSGKMHVEAWKSNDTTSRLSQCRPTCNLVSYLGKIYQLAHDCVFFINLTVSTRIAWLN